MMGFCGFWKAVPLPLLPLQWFEIANRWKESLQNDRGGGIHENTHLLIRDHGLKKKTCKGWWAAATLFLSEQNEKQSPWQEKLRVKHKQSLCFLGAWLIFISLHAWQDQTLFKLWKPTGPSGWRCWIQSQFQGVPCKMSLMRSDIWQVTWKISGGLQWA